MGHMDNQWQNSRVMRAIDINAFAKIEMEKIVTKVISINYLSCKLLIQFCSTEQKRRRKIFTKSEKKNYIYNETKSVSGKEFHTFNTHRENVGRESRKENIF